MSWLSARHIYIKRKHILIMNNNKDNEKKEEMRKDIPINEKNQQTDADNAETKSDNAEETEADKIAKLEAQIADLKKQQLYKAAEFDNFRKRVMQEKADLIKNGGTKVITTLLPVIDDLERAQENMDKYEDLASLKEGLNLIINKFFKLLAQEGLKKMDVMGASFNSDLHEAIAMVPGLPADQKGKVIDCMTAGYTLNDKVIRYAKVAVAE